MAKKRWQDLSPRARTAILTAISIDASLRATALVDLKQRGADEVNGSRKAWAVALTLVNSAGVLPVVYFLRGRRTTP